MTVEPPPLGALRQRHQQRSLRPGECRWLAPEIKQRGGAHALNVAAHRRQPGSCRQPAGPLARVKAHSPAGDNHRLDKSVIKNNKAAEGDNPDSI